VRRAPPRGATTLAGGDAGGGARRPSPRILSAPSPAAAGARRLAARVAIQPAPSRRLRRLQCSSRAPQQTRWVTARTPPRAVPAAAAGCAPLGLPPEAKLSVGRRLARAGHARGGARLLVAAVTERRIRSTFWHFSGNPQDASCSGVGRVAAAALPAGVRCLISLAFLHEWPTPRGTPRRRRIAPRRPSHTA